MHDIDGLQPAGDPRGDRAIPDGSGACRLRLCRVGILRQLPHGAEVPQQVLRLVEAARRAGVPVFFLRRMSLPRKLAGVFQLRQAMAWQRVSSPAEVKPWFLRDSPGFQLAPELGVTEDEAVF